MAVGQRNMDPEAAVVAAAGHHKHAGARGGCPALWGRGRLGHDALYIHGYGYGL